MPPKYAPGRDGLKEYNDKGFVPYPEYSFATTKTLEYAFDDFNIWKLGTELNKVDDIDLYVSKSLYYKNVFDKERGFMNGKNVDGDWLKSFDPIEWGGPFSLGNAWHYTFNVQHDINGLISLMGGKKEFTQKLMDHVIATSPYSRMYNFTPADIKVIEKIRDEKYATQEWNYGYSPDYSFKKGTRTNGGTIEMNLDVEKGIIRKAKIFGDFFNEKDITEIEKDLENTNHNEAAIRERLKNYNIGEYFRNMTIDDLLSVMF